MEIERPSRAISAGLIKMPVPIIVPTTMAPEAHAPRPRMSSRREPPLVFGVPRSVDEEFPVILVRARSSLCSFGSIRGLAEARPYSADYKGHDAADEYVPCIRNRCESPNAKHSRESRKHSDKRAGGCSSLV